MKSNDKRISIFKKFWDSGYVLVIRNDTMRDVLNIIDDESCRFKIVNNYDNTFDGMLYTFEFIKKEIRRLK